MENSFREIRVFISSRCVGDYIPVRQKLFRLLKSSTVFEPSMFEGLGAATGYPKEVYTRELIDCDVCVFIIRNDDGLSEGVLDEIDCAIARRKKSLFYFCGYKSLPSELENRLAKSSMPVFRNNIPALEDVPQVAFADLQKDVLDIYRGYCNEYYIADLPYADKLETLSFPTVKGKVLELPKSIIKNVKSTTTVFEKFIMGDSDEACEPDNALDGCSSDLARRFLFSGGIDSFNWEVFVNEAEKSLGDSYPSDVIRHRWKCIVAFFQERFEDALDHQKAAYSLAVEQGSPEWLVKDIIIDLRNIQSRIEFFPTTYQTLLDESATTLSYPLLDREQSEFYSDLLKDQQNNLERSIYTVTIGKSLNSPIDHVAKSFFISAIYGSLTHLLITNDLLECFALFLCEQYGTNRFGSLSMNMLLRSGDGKKIEGMVQSLDNLDDPKTPHNAYSVYEMASACAMPGRRLATRFEAFRRLGIYMSDADFTMATASFMCAAQAFEVGDIRDVSTGVSLVNAIHANAPRIDKGWANSQLLRMMETGLLEVQKEVLKVVEWGAIDLKIADEDYIIRLIEAIEKAADRHSDFLGYQAAIALFTLCSERPELTERCSKAADEHLNERYREVFFTEVSDKDETALESIERFISIIEENNQRQGENGVWVQSSVAEYDNTANLIASLADPPLEIIARAAQAALGTLLNKNSFLSDKTNAYIMMMRLLALPAVQGIEDLDITAEDILKININTVSSPMIYENEALINLSIDHEVFLYAVGLSDGSRLEDLLIETYAAREFDQAHAAKALTSMLNAIDLSMLEPKIASFLHAYAGSLFKSPSFQVRIVVIELLFVMLGIPMLASNISRQLVNSYDAKSSNEKCRIIRHHGAIHDANADVWVELKRKALNDSCSISRLLAEEVF